MHDTSSFETLKGSVNILADVLCHSLPTSHCKAQSSAASRGGYSSIWPSADSGMPRRWLSHLMIGLAGRAAAQSGPWPAEHLLVNGQWKVSHIGPSNIQTCFQERCQKVRLLDMLDPIVQRRAVHTSEPAKLTDVSPASFEDNLLHCGWQAG